jgi:hypothetical protein
VVRAHYREYGPGWEGTRASGAIWALNGRFHFGTAPLANNHEAPADHVHHPSTVGCLLDLDAGAMTVFVNGEPLTRQCEYRFATDREWAPTVGLRCAGEALFSNTV